MVGLGTGLRSSLRGDVSVVSLAGAPIQGGGGQGPTPPFNITPYDFTGKDSYISSDPWFDAYETTFNTAHHPTDGYIDIAVEISLTNVAGLTTALFSRWGTNQGTQSYLFGVDSANGQLRLAYYTTAVAFRDPHSSVTLASVLANKTRIWVRAVLNASASIKNGFAAGTCTFFTSADGVTWNQLGAVVTGLNTDGFQQGGTQRATVGTINSSNVTYGRFYRAIVKASDGSILYNPDFRTKTVGQKGTFNDTAATPAGWTINGPILCDMAPRATTYPRLKTGQAWKLKTLEISPDAALSNANGDWGKLWTNYPGAQMAERIQWAKDRGANSVKWTCSGSRVSYNNYPSLALLETYIADVCGVLRSKGMFLYLSLAHSDEMAAPDGTGRETRCADIRDTAALWMKYGADVIVGVDLCNEVQFGFAPGTAGLAQGGKPSTWGTSTPGIVPTADFGADMAYFYKLIRTVMPDVPMTFSAYMNSRAALGANGQLISQASLEMQFHDYHPYNLQNGKVTADDLNTAQFPDGADVTPLEAKLFFLGGHLIGECGIQRRHSDANKTAFFNGLIAQASATKSLGWAGAFIDYDYTSSNEPGDYGIRQDAVLTERFNSMSGNFTVTA